MKKIAVLGVTGSIGQQTLDVVRENRSEFEIVSMTAHTDAVGLLRAANEFSPKYIALSGGNAGELRGAPCKVGTGEHSVIEAATLPDVDIVVAAIVGMAGLRGVVAAVEAGKDVALANKESLVAAGELVNEKARKSGSRILPVDSEHSAVWQALEGGRENVKRLILTASGGAYYKTPSDKLDGITPEQAVKHPNWKMGAKISIDSATMMNKGFEIIEAHRLFDIANIDYVIHPQSIVHSMIEYEDGAIMAQASYPDMRLPISYALFYPTRHKRNYTPLSLPLLLDFLPPNEDKFPAPAICRKAFAMGGSAPCVLNAANEAAVSLFLRKKIKFRNITELVENTLIKETIVQNPTLDDLIKIHESVIARMCGR